MKYNKETIEMHSEKVKKIIIEYPDISSYAVSAYLKERNIPLSRNYVCKLMRMASIQITKESREKAEYKKEFQSTVIHIYSRVRYIFDELKRQNKKVSELSSVIIDCGEQLRKFTPYTEPDWGMFT